MFFSNFVNRFWSIIKLHAGCPEDIGWLTGSFEPPGGCLFDLTNGSFPVFRACPGNSSCLMESGQYSYVYLYQFFYVYVHLTQIAAKNSVFISVILSKEALKKYDN